jgi:two-component system alkaline phosphatase synthesis response regulator PhoP
MSDEPLILIADDDEDILTLVQVRLERAGFRVVTAKNGHEAIELARAEPPSLAVLDVMMPHLDGYGVLKAFRADPQLAATPVVMLSARVHADDVDRGLEAGADEYLAKPFRSERLLEVVRELLAR